MLKHLFFVVMSGCSILCNAHHLSAHAQTDKARVAHETKAKHPRITTKEFRRLMQTVADGWNAGDARKAANCYAEDAVYLEPPDKQMYVGRAALFEFFGGEKRPQPPMKMRWHHLAFDEETQIGFGEYTFEMNNRYHGIVTVKVVGGKISRWREYQYKSEQGWEDFVGKSRF